MRFLAHALVLVSLLTGTYAVGGTPTLLFSADDEGLQLGGQGLAPTILLDSGDSPAVLRAAKDLAADFGRVLGTNGTVWLSNAGGTPKAPAIIAGTIGKSKLIDDLIAASKLDVAKIKDQWESYISTIVESPMAGIDSALVLVGSDRRGTVYAMYDISEQIGVSPLYWWADVPPKPKTHIVAKKMTKVQGPPSVKYRGLFLNDEQPALTNWVREKYGGVYNANFHANVFELILRLKGNYFWPAMWDGMFYVDDAKNGPLADTYGIVVGTSHTEPLARSTKEQGRFMSGQWDWKGNSNNVKKFMQEGVTRAKNWETLWTTGMRGNHDTASATLTPKLLEEIIAFQQNTLKTTLGQNDLTKIPHMWCLYKEVGGYYQSGMKVPDEVTLLWSDDNVGNLERLPTAAEANRKGGAGVYYHFDYVGSPRNYKWINTIQIAKTWEQMRHAYARDARTIWVANVGDLKALEIPLSHFLDMAYDITQFTEPTSSDDWLKAWATRDFGAKVADQTAAVVARYSMLIARRKYELLTTSPFVYNTQYYDEAETTLSEWVTLVNTAQSIYDSLDADTQVAFFEMVLHPVLAGKTVHEIYIKAAMNSYYSKQKRTSTNTLAAGVRAAFAEDGKITQRFHALKGGKWNHMMDQVHLGYNNWQDPGSNSMPGVTTFSESNSPANGIMGVAVQGSTNSVPGDQAPAMIPLTNFMPPAEPRYIDIYTRGSGSFSFDIKTDKDFVTITPSSGTVSSPGNNTDLRAKITVDWDKAPEGKSNVAITVTRTGATGTTLTLPIRKDTLPDDFKGFVESNGVVSIEAGHYTAKTDTDAAKYITIPNYGRTHSGVTLSPPTIPTQSTASGPKLTYKFFALTEKNDAKVTLYLASTLNFDPTRPQKYAFAIDDGQPKTVQYVPTSQLGTAPAGWDTATMDNTWRSTQTIGVKAGARELHLWALEPGVVFTKVVIDLGGVKSSYLGPPESFSV